MTKQARKPHVPSVTVQLRIPRSIWNKIQPLAVRQGAGHTNAAVVRFALTQYAHTLGGGVKRKRRPGELAA